MRKSRTAAAAAITAALMILGGPAAEAAPVGTLVAPYESASSDHFCWAYEEVRCATDAKADEEGNLRAGVSLGPVAHWGGGARSFEGTGWGLATVVAAHQLEESAGAVTYAVNFLLPKALTTAAASACCHEPSGSDAYASLGLTASAHHSTCESCRGFAGWSSSSALPAPPVGQLTVRVTNHAGGTIPAGTIRISVRLGADAGLVLHSWGTFSLCSPDGCRPEVRPGHGVGSASALGEAKLTSIDYEIETSSTPNQPPTAAFAVSCSGRDCTFDASSSSDPDGQIAGYSWDFGDGTGSQAGPSVQHRYPEGAASFVVTLTVTDNRGGTDAESLSVKCTKKNQNKPTSCS